MGKVWCNLMIWIILVWVSVLIVLFSILLLILFVKFFSDRWLVFINFVNSVDGFFVLCCFRFLSCVL